MKSQEETFGIVKEGRRSVEILRVAASGEVTIRAFDGSYVPIEVNAEELEAMREAEDIGQAMMVVAGMLARRVDRRRFS